MWPTIIDWTDYPGSVPVLPEAVPAASLQCIELTSNTIAADYDQHFGGPR